MSDHLPECEWSDNTRVNRHCICPALRACEQRVRDEERSGAPVAMIELAGYSRGYAAGVQAALKVVEPWLENHSLNDDDLMNTIDALRRRP